MPCLPADLRFNDAYSYLLLLLLLLLQRLVFSPFSELRQTPRHALANSIAQPAEAAAAEGTFSIASDSAPNTTSKSSSVCTSLISDAIALAASWAICVCGCEFQTTLAALGWLAYIFHLLAVVKAVGKSHKLFNKARHVP